MAKIPSSYSGYTAVDSTGWLTALAGWRAPKCPFSNWGRSCIFRNLDFVRVRMPCFRAAAVMRVIGKETTNFRDKFELAMG